MTGASGFGTVASGAKSHFFLFSTGLGCGSGVVGLSEPGT
jgi:hypothetical protein